MEILSELRRYLSTFLRFILFTIRNFLHKIISVSSLVLFNKIATITAGKRRAMKEGFTARVPTSQVSQVIQHHFLSSSTAKTFRENLIF